MHLSKENLTHVNSEVVAKPSEALFELPEKVLQFGTGVLLRGLPDYFIDKANKAGLFNGRIVVVKSTDTGDTSAFAAQDGLYTLCIRGITENKNVEENLICSAISRVLSAKEQWEDVLECAHNPALKIIISNTTEVGIQPVQEAIHQHPPASFPGKLLAVLYERFKMFGDVEAGELVVLPTELITDNGKKLKEIVIELAHFNKLEPAFFSWIDTHTRFCNTLVDCIVPGKPERSVHQQLEKRLGYTDALLTVSEVYRLWAIEGDEDLKKLLSFADVDNRLVITPDITKFKELKLRLLNGTHTLSCGLAHLGGIGTVKEAMNNTAFSAFIAHLMQQELAPAIPFPIPETEKAAFGLQVLDRFRNPHIEHRWLSITAQYTSKMAQRTIPLLLHYCKLYNAVPPCFATGFAAYLLFTRPIKKEGTAYWGDWNGALYPVNDDAAAYYFELWSNNSGDEIVSSILRNETLWGSDLTKLNGFEAAVKEKMHQLQTAGVPQTLSTLFPDKQE